MGTHLTAHEAVDTLRRFCLWVLARLDVTMLAETEGVYDIEVPKDWQIASTRTQRMRFTFDAAAAIGDGSIEVVAPRGRLPELLARQLAACGIVRHLHVRGQPASVHEIAGPMFAAYRVDGGGVSLAGCRLEDKAFLRWTTRQGEGDGASNGVVAGWLDSAGREPAADEIAAIGLESSEVTNSPPRVKPERLARWIDAVLAKVGGQAAAALSVDVIWCKYASGKLRFTIGDQACDLEFRGWAHTLKPPPIDCPLTREHTFHLSATSDGRIAAAERIGICAVSGRRMLDSELVRCRVTDQHVLPAYAGTCHVTGEPVLRDKLIECALCRQAAHPDSIKRGVCDVCRRMEAVTASDARLSRVLGEYPRLDFWRRWKLGEGTRSYVMIGARWLASLLIVIDRQTLEVSRLATGSRLQSQWTDVPETRRAEYLA